MSCSTKYQAQLKSCLTTCRVKVNLLQTTLYKVVFTDKFGTKYSATVSSDGFGYLDIDFTQFDVNLFTAYSGSWLMEIFNEANQQVTFTVCGNIYASIEISFYNGSGVNDYVIQGQCTIIGNNTTVTTGYFTKEFTFVSTSYSIPVTEHLFATQIFSIEVLAKVDNVWQNIEFLYTIANNNDLEIQSSYDGYEMRIIITGIE